MLALALVVGAPPLAMAEAGVVCLVALGAVLLAALLWDRFPPTR